MPDARPILIISGTNRPNSHAMNISRRLLEHYKTIDAPAEIFSLLDLPCEVFQPSAYITKPPAMIELQQRVLRSQGLHIVVPEYNGSFPGVLKYFIDMLKFPESFERKPVAFVGEAGMWGGLRAVEQLQMVFGYRNAHIFPERVFITAVSQKFDTDGHIKDPAIDERLKKQAAAFASYAALFI